MEILNYVREQWDRVGAGVAVVAGALLLVLGWTGVSNRIYPGEQIPYIVSGGLGGIFLLGVGAVLWISADLRDEWRKLDDLEDSLGRIEAALGDAGELHVGKVEAEPAQPNGSTKSPARRASRR